MRRREFITLVGSAAAWPMMARAQRPAMPVIGYLSTGSRESDPVNLAAFRQGLGEIGYVEGQNVTIEYRWAEFHYDRLSAMADDLVRRPVTAIAAIGGTPRHSRQRQRPRRFRLFSISASTRSSLVSLPASTGPAEI